MHDFVISVYPYLENTDLLNYTSLPNVDKFLYI